MTLSINPEVFTSAVNASHMKLDALNSSYEFEDYLNTIFKAANATYSQNSVNAFKTVPGEETLTENLTGNVRTIGMIFQTEEDMPQYFDADFEVRLGNDYIYRPSISLYSRTLKKVEENKAIFARSDTPMKTVGTDNVSEMVHQVFHWILTNLPEQQHAQFLENCKDYGLTQDQQFGFPTTNPPSKRPPLQLVS